MSIILNSKPTFRYVISEQPKESSEHNISKEKEELIEELKGKSYKVKSWGYSALKSGVSFHRVHEECGFEWEMGFSMFNIISDMMHDCQVATTGRIKTWVVSGQQEENVLYLCFRGHERVGKL